MMTGRDPHTVLGVAPGASLEEVRRAYLLRTKVLHPDRFDPEKQPTEWKQAHEMLRELNEAYSALRQGAPEAPEEESKPATEKVPEPPQSGPPATVPPQPEHPAAAAQPKRSVSRPTGLRSGIAFWDSMEPTLKARLLDRQREKVRPQFHADLPGAKPYAMVAICVLIGETALCLLLRFKAEAPDAGEMVGWLSAAAVLGAVGAMGLVRLLAFGRCRLRDGVCATPLHFVIMESDQVRYYPLWELYDRRTARGNLAGFPAGTGIKLGFAADREAFTLASRADADQLLDAIKVFAAKGQKRWDEGNLEYFRDEDDFRQRPTHDTRRRGFSPKVRLIITVLVAACFLGLAAWSLAGREAPTKPPVPVRGR